MSNIKNAHQTCFHNLDDYKAEVERLGKVADKWYAIAGSRKLETNRLNCEVANHERMRERIIEYCNGYLDETIGMVSGADLAEHIKGILISK
ncbi:MAG: hypothetical protein ABI954_11195 [Pyrinomonadaceae bacterium]